MHLPSNARTDVVPVVDSKFHTNFDDAMTLLLPTRTGTCLYVSWLPLRLKEKEKRIDNGRAVPRKARPPNHVVSCGEGHYVPDYRTTNLVEKFRLCVMAIWRSPYAGYPE